MTDIFYDIIIVGASDAGIEAAKYYFAKDKKVLLVSRHFDNFKRQFAKIPYMVGNIVWSEYYRGIIKLFLETGEFLCCKNVILAVGTKHIEVKADSQAGIYYNINSIKNTRKFHKLVIMSDSITGLKNALDLKDKFKTITICTSLAKIEAPDEVYEEIENANNITILPFCKIKDYLHNSMGCLYKVILDTYAELPCHYVLANTNRVPEKPCLAPNMIELDADGYYIVNKHYESRLVPGVFAIGACIKDKDLPRFGNILLK